MFDVVMENFMKNILMVDDENYALIKKKCISKKYLFNLTSNIFLITKMIEEHKVDVVLLPGKLLLDDLHRYKRVVNCCVKNNVTIYIIGNKYNLIINLLKIESDKVKNMNENLSYDEIYFFLDLNEFKKTNENEKLSDNLKEVYQTEINPNIEGRDIELVRETIKLIKNDLSINFNMNYFIQELNTTELKLSNAFLKYYKCTVFAWIREEKLLMSRKLIMNGFGNITEICYLLGYSDLAHFSRAFKCRFGCSPKKMHNRNFV